MNSPYFIQFWQRLAHFCISKTKRFCQPSDKCKLSEEALLSTMGCAFVCQNRYPSPSRGPGQNVLSRPSWFWGDVFSYRARVERQNAQKTGNLTFVIAYQRPKTLQNGKGEKPENQRGEKTCKRLHSFSWPRFWACRPVAQARTLNARSWAARQVASLRTCWKKVNALPARRLALRVVPWPTTSKPSFQPNALLARADVWAAHCPGMITGHGLSGQGAVCALAGHSIEYRYDVQRRASVRRRFACAGGI